MWNGVIHSAGAGDAVPTVVVQGKSANSLSPDNLAHPASHIVFYEKGAASKSLSEAEAVQRYVRTRTGPNPVHDSTSHISSIIWPNDPTLQSE